MHFSLYFVFNHLLPFGYDLLLMAFQFTGVWINNHVLFFHTERKMFIAKLCHLTDPLKGEFFYIGINKPTLRSFLQRFSGSFAALLFTYSPQVKLSFPS